MNSRSGANAQALEVLDGYLEPNGNLLNARKIFSVVFEEEYDFNNWTDVRSEIERREWSDELLKQFVVQTKSIVESGAASLSESYFWIVDEDTLTPETIRKILKENKYESSESDIQDGFLIGEDDGRYINARYVYTDIDTNLTYGGEIEKFVEESSISFRIDLERRLLILESTFPPDAQKIKSAFLDVEIPIVVVAEPGAQPEPEEGRLMEIIESLPLESAEGSIDISSITGMKLWNPGRDTDEVTQVEVEGYEVGDSDEVNERLSEGWIVQGIEFRIEAFGSTYDVTINISSVMSYIKVDNFQNYGAAKEVLDELRDQFIDAYDFRF